MALPNGQYTVGWICALRVELTAARQFLDKIHGPPNRVEKNDTNHYLLGEMARHNVVIAVLPVGLYGTSSATSVARDMVHSFPNVRIGLMVGIGGGAPSTANDIRLGDVVVSTPAGVSGGVFQYDFGKTIQERKFQHTGHLNHTPTVLLSAVQGLGSRFESDGNGIAKHIEDVLSNKENLRKTYGQPDPESDILYASNVVHPNDEGQPRQSCIAVCGRDSENMVDRPDRSKRDENPMVFEGIIASANSLMKDALIRDKLARENGVLCFEMEAAGLMNNFPCLVVRGICDYSDSHKNDMWHGYAAMSAAAYAKELLAEIPPIRLESQQKLVDRMKNIQESISEVKTATTTIQSTVKDIDTDQKHSLLKNWLRPCDPSTNHLSARNHHFTGSGNWLVQQNPRFAKWMTQPHSFLWLYGFPGCGKTVLSSTIIEYLNKSRVCLYFYFTFQDQEKLSLDSMLRVLLWQLCSKHEASKQVLNQLHASCEQGYSGNPRQPSTKELSTAFLNMLKLGQEVWIVIDALDECSTIKDSDNAQGLIAWIKTMMSLNIDHVHLLATSRDEDDIRAGLKDLSGDEGYIPIEGEGLNKDIEAYVKARITQGDELKRWRKIPEVQQNIQEKVLEKASGMFRYVACQIRDLETCIDRESLYNALENLPEDLNETYSRIMSRIPIGYKSKTIRVLQFLTYSGRPLKVEELVDAIAVNLDKSISFDPLDRVPEPTEIARYCSSLTKFVKDEDQKMELHLAHFSVKEYLLSDSENLGDFNEMVARASIAKVCMSYLRQVEPDQDEVKVQHYETYLTTMFPFAEYSANNWMKNAAAAEKENKTVFQMTIDFLVGFDRKYYKNWTVLHRYDGVSQHRSPLSYACNAGLSIQCLEHILEDKAITVQDDEEEPLTAACRRRDLKAVEFLIENGADPRDIHLYHPCKNGDEEIVKLLLGHGQLNPSSEWGSRAFKIACYIGHLQIVELLFEKSPKAMYARPTYYAQVLMDTCVAGHELVALLLLQHGAVVMDKKSELSSWEDFGTALEAAVARGLESVVKTMVQKFSAVLQGHEFMTAVQNGYTGIVQILWDSKRFDKEDLNRALFWAAMLGYAPTVLLLLSFGADINFSSGDQDRMTALEVAQRLGQKEVVSALLQEAAKKESEVQYGHYNEEPHEDQKSEDDQKFDKDQKSNEVQESNNDKDSEENRKSTENQQVDEGQGREELKEAGTVSSNPAFDAGFQKDCSKLHKGALRIDCGLSRSDTRDENLAENAKDEGPEVVDSWRHQDSLNEGCDPRDKNGKTLDTYVEHGKHARQEVTNSAVLKAEEGSQRGEGDDDGQTPIKDRNESKQVTEHARDSRWRNRSCGWGFSCLNPRGGKGWSLSVTCWTDETSS